MGLNDIPPLPFVRSRHHEGEGFRWNRHFRTSFKDRNILISEELFEILERLHIENSVQLMNALGSRKSPLRAELARRGWSDHEIIMAKLEFMVHLRQWFQREHPLRRSRQ